MKTKDPIYIVKGKTKSALINLETKELRSISNIQLNQLTDDVDLEENLLDYTVPDVSVYQKEILDIKLSKECGLKRDFSFLNPYIKDGTAYLNVRTFCPEEKEVSIAFIQALTTWINDTIFHFGLIIFIPELYPNKEQFFNYFSAYRLLSKKTTPPNPPIYKPMFHSSPNSILISQKNNLYHYSRDTLVIDGATAQLIDHNLFNIPKSKIENCKDCEFRLTCFDLREVQQVDGKYHYTSTCQHELDR
ncbi:MAG: hypothetical protein JKY03_00135 [Aureispira sp.]|nr:hypothetical protein [Aureispira sp.]